MKLGLRNIFIVIVLATVSSPVLASKISKGFEALEIHDYFKAKKLFTKALKRDPSPSAFGLATIYSRNNNPFYSKDSAYVYLQLAEQEFGNAKEKKREKWKIYGWHEEGISKLRNAIEFLFYEEVLAINTVVGYTQFIQEYPTAIQIGRVTEIRDSIAFFHAVSENTAAAYNQYAEKYPSSAYADIALENYFDSQFEEVTGNGSLASYLAFMELSPTSPMVPHAEAKIFEIVTEPNTVEAYSAFITTYPENQFVDSAWRQLYQTVITDYSLATLKKFKEAYPVYPQMDQVDLEIAFMDSILFPNYVNGKYGFMNCHGIQLIAPIYEQVSPFQEGLAVVMLNGKYGVINYQGRSQIPFKYDAITEFINGRAVIEEAEKLGLIHRNGRRILECTFDDLGMISDGLIYASTNGKYGYYDGGGRLRIPEKYDDAYDFIDGVAKVEINGLHAYIDIYDAYVAQPAYAEIEIFSDSLFAFSEDGLIGLMDRLAKVVVPAQFDDLGRLHEGYAIASIEGEVVYLNEKGEIVIQNELETFPNFISKGEFINGEAVAMKDEEYGRIDIHGKTTLSFKYDNLGTGEHAVPFEDDEFWGIINAAGKVLISAEYDNLHIEDNTYVLAENEDGAGVLDLKGNVVVPFAFDEIEYLAPDVFSVRQGNLLGIMKNDDLQVSVEFDSIGAFGEDFLLLSKSGILSYYDLGASEVITTKDENGE